MASKELKIYLAAMKHIFNTPKGIEVLKWWKEEHVDCSALVPGDTNATMFSLGKKEFVQECIMHVNRQDLLDEPIKIETENL